MPWILGGPAPISTLYGTDAAGAAQDVALVTAGGRSYTGSLVVDVNGRSCDPAIAPDMYSSSAVYAAPAAAGAQVLLLLRGSAENLVRVTRWWVQEGLNIAAAPPNVHFSLLRLNTLNVGAAAPVGSPHHEPGAAVAATALLYNLAAIVAATAGPVYDDVVIINGTGARYGSEFGGVRATMNGVHAAHVLAATPQLKQPIDLLGLDDALGIQLNTNLPANPGEYILGFEWMELRI